MTKGRMEAFSDGVLAIIITIMVLEVKVPHSGELKALKPLIPVLLSYLLSFIYVGIYWNNHHHLMQVVERVDGTILWANIHLLFWLSLIPFASGWMGENHFAQGPVIVYGVVLLMCAFAYAILVFRLAHVHPKDSVLARAIGKDYKGKISIVCYIMAVAFAFVDTRGSMALYA